MDNNNFQPTNPVFSTQQIGQPTPVAQSSPASASKPAKNPHTIIYITVALGIIALITSTICVWLLIDKTKSKDAQEAATTRTQATEQETTKSEITAKTLGFTQGKITNPADSITYRLGVHRSNANGNGVFGAYIDTENSGVELYIYWEFAGAFYDINTGGRTDRQLARISFDRPVVDITIGEHGQYVGGDVLLFLLQDGTVEYMPIVRALENQTFNSFGRLGGLTDIVKFYHTDAIGDASGYITTLTQKTDGQIIDLQEFLRAATTPEAPAEETE